MTQKGPDQRTLDAALADAYRAIAEYDEALAWLEVAAKGPMDPIAAEVWVFDEACRQILLVNHRWRGWVPPGGTVEVGETPRDAACRELSEETGLVTELLELPAAVTVRSYRSGWAPTLGLSYVAVADSSLPVAGENQQPVAWIPLEHDWAGAFPQDRPRIREFARRLGSV